MKIFNTFIYFGLKKFSTYWCKLNRTNNARFWSNDTLRIIAPLFQGDIINVSAWNDSDKEGRKYRDYFSSCNSYSISNYKGKLSRNGLTNEIFINLERPLPHKSILIQRFDLVFTHTVLEHIFNIKTAINTLCLMSKDCVLTIVPFIQPLHWINGSFEDYWRISPFALQRLFLNEGFQTIFQSWNKDPIGNIYIFHLATKYPEKWKNQFETMFSSIDQNHFPGLEKQIFLFS